MKTFHVFFLHGVCLLSLAAHGSSIPGCDPSMLQALRESSLQGVRRSENIVHDTYKRPEPLFDLSCLDSLMDGLKGFSFLFDPRSVVDSFLKKARDGICDHANRMWGNRVRPDTFSPLADQVREIPGVRVESTDLSRSGARMESLPARSGVVLPRLPGTSRKEFLR